MSTELCDCGHVPTWTESGPHPAGKAVPGREEHTTGYGHFGERKLCHPCCEREEYRLFHASKPGDRTMAYLSQTGGQTFVTSWTGAILATVTRMKRTPTPYIGGRYVGPGVERVTFRAVDSTGRVWSGNSPATHGMYCRLRLLKKGK